MLLAVLWIVACFYVYAFYNASFFSGVHFDTGEPILQHAKTLVTSIIGLLMVIGPTILLSLGIRFAPESVLVKFLTILITMLTIAISYSYYGSRGPDMGVMLMLSMVISWLISVVVFGIALSKIESR